MDEETKKLIKKNLEVSQKSLAILKKMYRNLWYNRIFNVVKWLVLLGALAWVYTQLQPIFDQVSGIWDSIQSVPESIRQLPGL